MIISTLPLLRLFGVVALILGNSNVAAKKPIKSSAVSRARSPKSGSTTKRKPNGSRGAPPTSRRRQQYEDDEEEDEYLADDSYDDEEPDPAPRSRKRPNSSSRAPQSRPSRQTRPSPNRGPPPRSSSRRSDYDDYEEDYYEPKRSQSSRGGRRREPPRRGNRGRMVAYSNQPPAFTRGLTALRNSLPDPGAVKDAAFSSISSARETTSRLSSNLYRDIKGLTSSELEQAMLKATRPDDTPVKGKHVEKLVGVTYGVSARFNIYDASLRKLWNRMVEKDWRTKIKALYLLHRYSADAAPEHHDNLKSSLREFRRRRDEKRKCKYFNTKILLAGEITPENARYHAFISRYARYVLLRAQSFGGVFVEISAAPRISKKTAPKPITSTALRAEHLEAAKMVLKFGIDCLLKEGEECQNTAFAVERVAGDLIGLSTAVAISLNRALKNDDLYKGSDKALLKKWCEFYSEELLPKTRSMVKRTSSKLDAFGLYLPSRMGTAVSQEILQKGLKLVEEEKELSESDEDEEEEDKTVENAEATRSEEVANEEPEEEVEDDETDEEDTANDDEVEELYDDYEDSEFDYDEEYYDDEEE